MVHRQEKVEQCGNNCFVFTKIHFLFFLDTQLDYTFQPCLKMKVEISSRSRKLMVGLLPSLAHPNHPQGILLSLFPCHCASKLTSKVTLNILS